MDEALEIADRPASTAAEAASTRLAVDTRLRLAGIFNREELGESAPKMSVAISVGQLHLDALRERDPDHRRLNGEQIVEEPIAFVDAGAGAAPALHPGRGSDVIDVRVRVDDGGDLRLQALQTLLDHLEITAGIDHERGLRLRIAEDRAVAAERPDEEGLDDHARRVSKPSRFEHWLCHLSSDQTLTIPRVELDS